MPTGKPYIIYLSPSSNNMTEFTTNISQCTCHIRFHPESGGGILQRRGSGRTAELARTASSKSPSTSQVAPPMATRRSRSLRRRGATEPLSSFIIIIRCDCTLTKPTGPTVSTVPTVPTDTCKKTSGARSASVNIFLGASLAALLLLPATLKNYC